MFWVGADNKHVNTHLKLCLYHIIIRDLLVADNAVIGNCIDTVNVRSDPVGNITDLFLLDFTTTGEVKVWLLYMTEVSLASFKDSEENLYVEFVKEEA